MKKKILSLALACLMIMTAMVTLIPAASAQGTGSSTPMGTSAPQLTADEQELLDAGYSCYISGGNVTEANRDKNAFTAKGLQLVEVDGKLVVPFKWVTPVDSTKEGFATGTIAYDESDPGATALGWIYWCDSSGGYYPSWGTTLTLLKDIYTVTYDTNNGTTYSDPWGYNWCCGTGGSNGKLKITSGLVKYDGNGFTHTSATKLEIMASTAGAFTIENLNFVVKPVNMKVDGTQVTTNSQAIVLGNGRTLNMNNCTVTNETTAANNAESMFYLYTGNKDQVNTINFNNCVIKSEDQKYVFYQAGNHVVTNLNFTNSQIVYNKADNANNTIFYSGNVANSQWASTKELKVTLDKTTISGLNGVAANAKIMNVASNWSNTDGHNRTMKSSVKMNDSTVNTLRGFVDINKGDFEFKGNTTVTVGDTVFAGTNATAYTVKITDTATLVAPKLASVASGGTGTAKGTIISENPAFFHDSANDADMYTAPTLVKGASVRTADPNGLRFTANADLNNGANKTLGMLVAKTSVLEGKEFTIDGIKDLAGTANVNATEENKVVEKDGNYTYSVALCGMNEENYNTMYSARAYAIYNMNFATITVYSAYVEEDNVRSLAYVADMATKDLKTAKDEANGYIFEVETGKFSPYSKSQYDVVKQYAAKYVAPVNN